ncbi:MAG: hypothetical protein ACYSW0_23400 [Planctomycetota bacterium]|jgi:hypothetical protein
MAAFGYNVQTIADRLLKAMFVCLVIVFLCVVPAIARRSAKEPVELTLYPAKAPEPAHRYTLLPRSDDQADADAMPLYEKALQSLPGDFQMDEIERWLKTPPDELPRKPVQSTLQQFKPTLELLEQAAKCKQCDWPYLDDGELSVNMRRHRRLVFFLALQARFQIGQGRYDEAVGTMRTGLVMAKHLGEASTVIHRLFGISMAAYTCRQLEQFVQRPDAPSLYQALQELPQPFIDLTEQVEWEDQDTKGRVHLLMNRLDRHVAALQCVEALRLYAGAHDGKFPDKLSDVTEVAVPENPVSKKPFVYHRTGSKAALEAPAPNGATAKDTIRYQLILKK